MPKKPDTSSPSAFNTLPPKPAVQGDTPRAAASAQILTRHILAKLIDVERRLDAVLKLVYEPDPSPLNSDGDLPDWLDESYLPGDFTIEGNPDETPFNLMYWPEPEGLGECECWMSRAEYIELRRHLARLRGYNVPAAPAPKGLPEWVMFTPPDEKANHYELCLWRDDTGDADRDHDIELNRAEYIQVKNFLAKIRGFSVPAGEANA